MFCFFKCFLIEKFTFLCTLLIFYGFIFMIFIVFMTFWVFFFKRNLNFFLKNLWKIANLKVAIIFDWIEDSDFENSFIFEKLRVSALKRHQNHWFLSFQWKIITILIKVAKFTKILRIIKQALWPAKHSEVESIEKGSLRS